MGIDVKQLYQTLLREGKSPKAAAREAQERTGMSAVTGRAIRGNNLQFKQTKTSYLGQYGDVKLGG